MSVVIESLKTVADLKAKRITSLTTTTAPLSVSGILGYYEPGDRGGGLIVWAADSKDKNDGGLTIQPVGTTFDDKKGRWKRQYDEPISVKWFGARGDFNAKSGKDAAKNTAAILRLKVSRILFLLCITNEPSGMRSEIVYFFIRIFFYFIFYY